jgi:mannitol/fructose-specific phosphotransferase system IIA component (Ntr-type)
MPCELTTAGSRLSIADFTRPELIIPRLRETDPAGIIEELSCRLHGQQVITDMLSFYHAAMNREFLADSALPMGFATPHTRSPQVKKLTLAIGRCEVPVVWGGKGSWRVEHVFLIAVPATEVLGYLSLLSGIARFYYQTPLLDRLRAVRDEQGIFDLLKDISVYPG